LKPEFEYETVPKKNTHAYIKAKVTNTSNYPLLAGPANVFLDNNFVAKVSFLKCIFKKNLFLSIFVLKTQLKSYSPQEEFYCSLGVDPAIRIDYKPAKKFKAQTGLLSKQASVTYVQVNTMKKTGGRGKA